MIDSVIEYERKADEADRKIADHKVLIEAVVKYKFYYQCSGSLGIPIICYYLKEFAK